MSSSSRPTHLPSSLRQLARLAHNVGAAAAGLAADFWKDGGQGTVTPPASLRAPLWTARTRAALDGQIADAVAQFGPDPHQPHRDSDDAWAAVPSEIDGALTAGADTLWPQLREPLDLTPATRILCLGPGAGDLALWLAQTWRCMAVALTDDADLAARHLALSAHADLTDRAITLAVGPDALRRSLDPAAMFDAVLATDLASVNAADDLAALRPCLAKDALISWAMPVPEDAALTDAIQGWRDAGLDIRARQDITDLCRRQILTGLTRFVQNVAAMKTDGLPPNGDTRRAIGIAVARRAEQIAAIDNGQRIYHCQGILLD